MRTPGVIPFYMGTTLSKHELIQTPDASGFKACPSAAIVYSSRLPAISTGNILDRVRTWKIKDAFYLDFSMGLRTVENAPDQVCGGLVRGCES
jgi:hypothetical protein